MQRVSPYSGGCFLSEYATLYGGHLARQKSLAGLVIRLSGENRFSCFETSLSAFHQSRPFNNGSYLSNNGSKPQGQVDFLK